MRILAPKGTQASFAKGFSKNDLDMELDWDGKLPLTRIYQSDDENEIILNTGQVMKIVGFETVDEEKGWYRVLVSIIGRV